MQMGHFMKNPCRPTPTDRKRVGSLNILLGRVQIYECAVICLNFHTFTLQMGRDPGIFFMKLKREKIQFVGTHNASSRPWVGF